MNPEARIAEALAEHRLNMGGYCICDQSTSYVGWPAHVAAVIAALPGIAIVQLPQADALGRWRSATGSRDDGWLKWSVALDIDGVPYASARRGPGSPNHAPEEFVSFAAALLAAALAAGGES